MDIDVFREDYINGIEAASLAETMHAENIFIRDVSDILCNDYARINNELDYECYIAPTLGTKKYKGMRLDAASIDVVTNTLNLLICDYNNGECKTINMENVNTMAQKMRAFVENIIKGYYKDSNIEEAQPVVTLAREFSAKRKSINKVQMFYVSTNKLGNRVKNVSQEPIDCLGEKYIVDYNVIDIEQIYQTKLPEFEKEDIVIDVDEFNAEIPCIKAEINAADYESYLAIVPGQFLADIYNRFQSRLLEDNVRSFLNVRGAVNKGIRGTILNEKDRFFTYNNGISTTAKDVEFEQIPGKGMVIKKLIGFQIINGGQTTASLAHAMIKDKADLSGIYVQMKLTKTREVDPDFVRLISKYANSQNKVTNADLSSNHPFYQRIENFSHGAQKITAPPISGGVNRTVWFFERVRGQYDQVKMKMTKAEIKVYERTHPKNQKFTKTDLAKYINTFNMLPHYVCFGADVNATKFNDIIDKQWDKDNTVFNEGYFKQLVAKAIMFKHVEKLISHEEWYLENKAYRAQLVTYTLAKFMSCINAMNLCMNYKKVWEMQDVPEEFDVDLKAIAKLMFDVIHDDSRSIENIGEYCKREKCWDVAKSKKYNLTDDTLDLLLTREDVKIETSRDRKEQVFNNGLDLEVQIFKLGAQFWHSVREKGLAQQIINPFEANLLDIAEQYCINDKVKFISNKQAKQIAQIMSKLEENGINQSNAIDDNQGVEKIGKLAKRLITELYINKQIPDAVVERLFEFDYSKELLGTWIPVFADDPRKNPGQNKDRKRYYVEPIGEFKGKPLYLTSEWYEDNRTKLMALYDHLINHEVIDISDNSVDSREFDKYNLPGETIGQMAKRLISELLLNGCLSDDVIEKLHTPEYSREVFGVGYPILAKSYLDEMRGGITYRYYVDPVVYNGNKYYITKEWFDHYREKLIAWYEKYSK